LALFFRWRVGTILVARWQSSVFPDRARNLLRADDTAWQYDQARRAAPRVRNEGADSRIRRVARRPSAGAHRTGGREAHERRRRLETRSRKARLSGAAGMTAPSETTCRLSQSCRSC